MRESLGSLEDLEDLEDKMDKKKTKHHAMVSQRIGPLKAWGKNLRYQGHFCIRWFSGEIYPEIPNSLLGFLSRKTRGYMKNIYLVGGIPTPPKKMNQLGWLFHVIPNIWKNKKCSKPPTRYSKVAVNLE